MRKLSWMIAAVLSTLPAWAGAVELGNARVDSHLTEHLKVVIPISGFGNTPLDEVKVRLAPQKFYDQAGLSLDNLAGNITFEIKEQGKQPVVIVHSKRIITDPILSLLLEVSSGESQVIKEYDLLLNPPVQGRNTAAASSALAGSKPMSPSAASWRPVANAPDVPMGGTYKVRPGDTLYEISRRAADNSKVPVRGMMQAIINANPDAFVDGNGNAMRAGATLKVPTAAVANTASAPPATSAPVPAASADNAALPATKLAAIDTPAPAVPAAGAAPAPQPKLELLSAEPTAAGSTTTPESGVAPSGATAEASAAAGAPPTVAASPDAGGSQQTNEAIASIDAKSAAMSKQIELLNEQLKQVQGLVSERNQNIAQLQEKVKQSEEQTQQIRQRLEHSNNNFWTQWGPYLLGAAGLIIIALLLIALSRGRRQPVDEPMPARVYESSVPKKIEPLVAASATTAAAVVAAKDVAAPEVPAAPVFNANSVVEEARLLLSYNLGEQAVQTLQDAIAQNPAEVVLYQELARMYSEQKDTFALNQVLAEIEEKFGTDQVPNLPVAEEVSAMHGAVNIFDTSYDVPAVEAEVTSHEPPAQPPAQPPVPKAFLDDIPSGAFHAAELEPLSFEVPSEVPEVVQEPAPLDFDFDSSVAASTTPSSMPDDALSLDMPSPIHASETEYSSSAGHEVNLPADEVDPATDTRLGLVEAFLSVGDKESYQMIADEIESEGNAALVSRLREIEQKFGHH